MPLSNYEVGKLYYKYEDVFWEGKYQPIISTWVYLGKQVLSSEATSEASIGQVFAFYDEIYPEDGSPASSVTQTFWSMNVASKTMLSWNAFRRFVKKISNVPCGSCQKSGSLWNTLDFIASNDATSASGKTTGNSSKEMTSYVKNGIYYSFGMLLEPRRIICTSRLCEGSDNSVWNDQKGTPHQTWSFSRILSRGLGIEKYGTPILCLNPSWSPWDEMCRTMSTFNHFVSKTRNQRTSGE